MGETKQKQIVYIGQEVRDKIRIAIDTLARPVKATLGPKGRNVAIRSERNYYLTKDGVSVAKSIYSHDPIEQIIIDQIKDVALETNKTAGDGTTTAMVIAEYLIIEGLKEIEGGKSPDIIKQELEETLELVLEQLDLVTKEVKSKQDLVNIATISANNNKEIGEIVSDAVHKTVKDSIIGISKSPTRETYLEVTSGYTIQEAGYVDKQFLTEGQSITLEDPSILLVDGDLNSLDSILNIMEDEARADNSLLVVAKSFGANVINIMLTNCKKGNIQVIPICTPGIRKGKQDQLTDIASYTGGEILTEMNTYPKVGKADVVVISKYHTNILKKSSNVDQAIKDIKEEYENTEAVYDKDKLNRRISNLRGTAATIYVGGDSELEMLETIDRVEDAVNATTAAREEGIIAGGGITLSNIAEELTEDCTLLLLEGIKQPMYAIIKNGYGDNEVEPILMQCQSEGKFGFNAKTGKIVDMFKEGIIDPVKVTKEAIKNATAIASMILTTEAIVLNEF